MNNKLQLTVIGVLDHGRIDGRRRLQSLRVRGRCGGGGRGSSSASSGGSVSGGGSSSGRGGGALPALGGGSFRSGLRRSGSLGSSGLSSSTLLCTLTLSSTLSSLGTIRDELQRLSDAYLLSGDDGVVGDSETSDVGDQGQDHEKRRERGYELHIENLLNVDFTEIYEERMW